MKKVKQIGIIFTIIFCWSSGVSISEAVSQQFQWEPVFKGIAVEDNIKCVYYSEQDNVCYVGTGNGLFRSYDLGLSYVRVFQRSISDVSSLCLKNDIFYIISEGKLFVGTEDKGLELLNYPDEILGVVTGEGEKVGVIVWSRSGLYTICEDGSFRKLGTGISWNNISGCTDEAGILYVSDGGKLLLSEDNGTTWDKITLTSFSGAEEEFEEGLPEEFEKYDTGIKSIKCQ